MDEENRRWLWELGAQAGGRRLWGKLESTRLPLCARCTGILMGELLAVPLWLLWHPGWLLSLALLLPMAYDGIFQYVYYVMSNNRKRVVTGLLAGYGSMTLYIRLVLLLVSRIR